MSTFGGNMSDAIKRRMDKQAAEGTAPKEKTEADKMSFIEKAKAKLGLAKAED
jgi:hypothetical protein